MSTIASILALLQLASSLLVAVLGNPQASPDMRSQAMSISNLAIKMAGDYVVNNSVTTAPQNSTSSTDTQAPTTPSTTTSNTSTQPTTTTPVASTPTSTVTPSCTLTAVSKGNSGVEVTWTSVGITQTGKLFDNYKGKIDGGIIQYDFLVDISPNGTQGSFTPASNFKAVFGGTTCYTTTLQTPISTSAETPKQEVIGPNYFKTVDVDHPRVKISNTCNAPLWIGFIGMGDFIVKDPSDVKLTVTGFASGTMDNPSVLPPNGINSNVAFIIPNTVFGKVYHYRLDVNNVAYIGSYEGSVVRTTQEQCDNQ